jgi:MFS family permease
VRSYTSTQMSKTTSSHQSGAVTKENRLNMMPVNNAKQTKNIHVLTITRQEKQCEKQVLATREPLQKGSLTIAIASALLARIAGRISFVIMSFYLGERFTSATAVVLILESFYITELLLSPLVGSFSDRIGRRPFLLLSPLLAAMATTSILFATQLFPRPNVHAINPGLIFFLLILLVERLIEGVASGMNVPATLGYITDVSKGSERLRVRVMTAFEIVTVAGITLAIPLGGKISSAMGTRGFFVVIGIYLLVFLLASTGLKESLPQHEMQQHSSLLTSLTVIRHKRIFTFLPAWFSVNALVGSWTTLILIMLAYPDPAADMRHPHQLLYGGFSKMSASLWVSIFALTFLLGMVLWVPLVGRMRRTTVMLISLGGLALMIVTLTFLNGLAENPYSLSASAKPLAAILVMLVIPGILLLSGFTPVALTQMSALADTLPYQRGAVMGLYSVVLAIGQLLGSVIGGFCVDLGGFYGLMVFSTVMGCISLISVLYIRNHKHDLIRVASDKIPAQTS